MDPIYNSFTIGEKTSQRSWQTLLKFGDGHNNVSKNERFTLTISRDFFGSWLNRTWSIDHGQPSKLLGTFTLGAVSRKNLKWPFLDVKMRQNGFLFRKFICKIFFLGHMGVKNGPLQKSTISLKMVQNRHNWVFFIGEMLKMMRIRFSTRFWENRMFDSLIL
jgi:hypothetical protein